VTKRKKVIIIVGLGCVISGVFIWRLRDIPFFATQPKWSIGIYRGTFPVKFDSPDNVRNPVLTANDVTDVAADYVADPFMIREDSTWYMFFEVMNAQTHQGDIGLAVSKDGLNWVYQHIVLDEPFHLSYPYVFKWRKDYYMIPESSRANSIRLYKAVGFPTQWSFVGTLLYGVFVDPSILRHDGRWWLFAGTHPGRNDTLRLYYASDLGGPWIEHPESPIVDGDAHTARPGGRVSVFDGHIVRYAQDDAPTYGNGVRAFEITELTPFRYAEKEILETPILKPSGTGWNAAGMHTIDPHHLYGNTWIACVDGYGIAQPPSQVQSSPFNPQSKFGATE